MGCGSVRCALSKIRSSRSSARCASAERERQPGARAVYSFVLCSCIVLLLERNDCIDCIRDISKCSNIRCNFFRSNKMHKIDEAIRPKSCVKIDHKVARVSLPAVGNQSCRS